MNSKFLGVSWNAQTEAWKAEMTHIKKHGGDGTRKFLGLYDDERSAAIAVDAFVRERMPGLTAKLNFPDMDPRDLARELAQVKPRERGRASPARVGSQGRDTSTRSSAARSAKPRSLRARTPRRRSAPVEGPPKKKRGLPEGAPAVSGEGRAESEATVAAQRKPAAKRP